MQWLLNGTRLDELNTSNVEAVFLSKPRLGVLEFADIPPIYNGTQIQCQATSAGNNQPILSGVTRLLIQGVWPYGCMILLDVIKLSKAIMCMCVYSGTSDKGFSERGATSM